MRPVASDLTQESKMTTTTMEVKQLKKETTFIRMVHGEGVKKLTLPMGKSYNYRCEKTQTEVIHIATYVDGDGAVWVNEVRKPIVHTGCDFCNPSPCTCLSKRGKPVVVVSKPNAQTVSMMNATAVSAANAITSRSVSGPVAVIGDESDLGEANVRKLQRVAEVLRGDVYQVNYYIPTSLNVENPSKIFRRHGFRLDGSNWVFPQKGLESKAVQQVLKEWDGLVPVNEQSTLPGFSSKTTVRYWVIKYTNEQLSAMRELAQSQLADELQKTHRSLIERIDSASQRLKEVQEATEIDGKTVTAKDRDKADNTYNGAMRSIVQEACERFEMCLKGAEIFDETGDLNALFGAVQDAIYVQALAANAMLRKKCVKTVAIPKSVMPNSIGEKSPR